MPAATPAGRRRWRGRLVAGGLAFELRTLASGHGAICAASPGGRHRGAKPRLCPAGPRGDRCSRATASKSSVCPPRRRRSRPQMSLLAPAAIIAKREVDIGDRVKAGQLLAEIVAPELDHQIAQAEATLGQLKAALQQAEANRRARAGDLGSRQSAGQQGLADRAARHHRRPDAQGAGGGGRRCAGQRGGGGSPAAGTASAEDLSARRRAVRRRHHPTQCRYRQPGAGRCDQRHVHVHDHAGQRDPDPGVRAAGRKRSDCSRESMPWCTCPKSRIAPFPAR